MSLTVPEHTTRHRYLITTERPINGLIVVHAGVPSANVLNSLTKVFSRKRQHDQVANVIVRHCLMRGYTNISQKYCEYCCATTHNKTQYSYMSFPNTLTEIREISCSHPQAFRRISEPTCVDTRVPATISTSDGTSRDRT